MKYITSILMFMLWMPSVNAEPCITEGALGQALNIVLAESEPVQSKSRLAGIVADSSKLSVEFKLNSGFADIGNDEFSDGFQNRAMISAKYPLMGGVANQTDKEKAAAKSAFYEAQEAICKAFINELQALIMLKTERDLKARLHEMNTDLLSRILAENDALTKAGKQHLIDWNKTSTATQNTLTAEHEVMKASRMLVSKHDALILSYGKNRWKELKVHTMAYIKAEAPTPKPILK